MNEQGTLTIGAFFDGRPGHEKQTSGIIAQLKKKADVEVVSVQVRKEKLSGQLNQWLSYLVKYRTQKNPLLSACDLLIGTGTHTHLPMLYQKHHYQIPVVICMSPAIILQHKFDLIIAPTHDRITDTSNVFRTIGPPNQNSNEGKHVEERTLILIGGVDPKSHHWLGETVIENVKKLVDQNSQKKFIVSSSPRTPKETILGLVQLEKDREHLSFFDYRDTPSGWVEQQYRESKEVWVTGDSISMVYEALSSGCMVGIIPVQWRSQNSKFRVSEEYLVNNEMVIELESYLEGKSRWEKEVHLNEAGRCADEIMKRLL